MRLRDTGTRLRGVTVAGEYGNQAKIDWTEGTLDKLDLACEMQPQSSSEEVVQQDRTVTRWTLFLPPGADMTAADRWRFAGTDYEVDGEVEPWRHRGREHHREVQLLRVSGG
jgi:hypothetical protein